MSRIRTASNLEHFFYELVRDAIESQQITTLQETEYYLVQLLQRFAKNDSRHEGYSNEALVCLLQRALEADREARIQILRRLGDLALYIAGYFPESLTRKLVDVDYYVKMGGTAYSSICRMVAKPQMQSLFSELSNKFPVWVNVLGQVSTQAQVCQSEQDLLRLYELWQRTGSRHALHLLQQEGILPHTGSEESH